MAAIKFVVDGKRVSVNADPQMPLLYALRGDLKMKNPHFGCGLAQCGACTVHLDGEPIHSCVTPLSLVRGKQVTTIYGLGAQDKPHPLQAAFVEEQVPQCGYCSRYRSSGRQRVFRRDRRSVAARAALPRAGEGRTRARLERRGGGSHAAPEAEQP